MKQAINSETGEIIEVEEDNEIALRETGKIIDYEKLYDFYEQKEYIESQIALIQEKAKPQIMAYMKANKLKNIKYNDMTISLRKGYMKQTFDSKKFKDQHEDLYNKYSYLKGIDETISVKFGGKD